MSFEISGTIKSIFPEQTFKGGFNKREFLLSKKDGKFEQEFNFECVKDKVELVDHLKEGDAVSVSFDIRCREWQGKYFTNLVAWKITGSGQNASDSSGDEPPFAPEDTVLDEEPPF
ncbi:MAG: Uncharacterised protein [Opitutia bacterium UBA7350]|nr:MAG: Uncharacterised protein [Opitutae bacterium UBA7350]